METIPAGEIERVVHDLLAAAHVAGPHELPGLVRRHITGFGGLDACCYLADLQQVELVPFLGPDEPNEPTEPLAVDATLAGRSYQQVQVLAQRSDRGAPVIWLPLLNGTERLGVLAVWVDAALPEPLPPVLVDRLRLFASLLAELVMTKTMYGDSIVRLRRLAPMDLAAEMQWSLLPPLSFASQEVSVAAALEPAYEVAGDSVDYAVNAGRAHVAVFDGMGHGLHSAQLAAMAVTAYRHARRGGHALADIAAHVDAVLLQAFVGASFTTAVLGELDTATGLLRWVNAGHPEPLLLRHGQLIKTLHADPRPPLGMHLPDRPASEPDIGVESLEPGDCVLFYTDGVTEARSPDGEFFGEQRLADLIVRNLAAGLPPAETTRRVVRALLEHQQGRLSDDATFALVQWRADVRLSVDDADYGNDS